MKICSGDNIFSVLFNIIELLAILFVCLLIFRNMVYILKIRNNIYDKIDIIVIFLTAIQLIIFIFQLFVNYFIFSLLISILKFSQNILICSLLLVIVLWKHSNITKKIINYFMISLLIADILIFLFGISYYNPLDENNCESTVNIIIVILSIIINIFIGFFSYQFQNNNSIIDDNYKKSNITSGYNSMDDLSDNGQEIFINRMYNQYLTNIRNILTMYLLILFPFLLSYLIEFVFYFFFSRNIIFENEDDKEEGNSTNNNLNAMYFNEKNNQNSTNDSCNLIRNYGKNFNFINLILCLFGFIIRDFLPHFCVYVVLFKYKIKNSARASF